MINRLARSKFSKKRLRMGFVEQLDAERVALGARHCVHGLFAFRPSSAR